METMVIKPWMKKINKLNTDILMPIMAVTFLLFNTVVNLWLDERLETLQNVLAILVLAIVCCNIVCSPKDNIFPWLKANTMVVGYFAVRAISLVLCGFDYSVIRTIFFEVFFLVGICNFSIGNKKGIYINLFIIIELVFSFVSLFIYYANHLTGGVLNGFLSDYTYFDRCGNAMMFANPNTAGLFAGFAIVLATVLYGNKKYDKRFLLAFGVYNVAALILFGCRSADLGVIAVIVTIALLKVIPVIKKRQIVALTLILSALVVIPIYAICDYSLKVNDERFSYYDFEQKVDNVSTGRYLIWKESYMIQQDDMAFGKGNLKLEQEARQELVSRLDTDYYWRYISASDLGPHNGYIGFISAAGWVGFGMFLLVLLQRIKNAVHLENSKWYLLLVFSFVINLFESLFILNRFFTCFYMLVIMETDMENTEAL